MLIAVQAFLISEDDGDPPIYLIDRKVNTMAHSILDIPMTVEGTDDAG